MAAKKHNAFRVTVTKNKVTVTGYADADEAMKNGNSPVFTSAEDLEGGMSLAHINQAIHQLSGKPDTKPFEDPTKAAKALWPLLKKKSAAGAAVKPETKDTKKPATKKPTTKKPTGAAASGGNRGKIMTPTVKENPYRAGSKSFHAFQMVMDDPGKTFQHYVDKGARVNTLSDAIRNSHVKLTNPK
jgi:hypothetical protein